MHARWPILVVLALSYATPSFAAQTVHLALSIDGNAIEGESPITSLDRANTIVCQTIQYGFDKGVSGTRVEPIVILKMIDKTSPLLARALDRDEPITEAKFRFYRPSPGGAGAEEHYLTLLLENVKITQIRPVSTSAMTGGESAPPMLERVTFTATDITQVTVTYEIGGATHQIGAQ